MSQPTPGGPEEAVLQWLGERAEVFEATFFAFVGPAVQHPGFAIAILATVVYLAISRKGKKRR